MFWIKALAIGVAVIVVFSMFSFVWHLLSAGHLGDRDRPIVAVALKARSQLRGRREAKTKKIETEQAQAALEQRQLDVRSQTVQRQQDAVRLNQDVEDELARLKREME